MYDAAPDTDAQLTALVNSGWTRKDLAQRLQVAESTLSRWISARSRPHPETEAKIRELSHETQKRAPAVVREPQFDLTFSSPPELLRRVDEALKKMREALHTRGRLSGRNDALDEVAKLLFAHIIAVSGGSAGVTQAVKGSKSPARALAEFVAEQFAQYLPDSLSHEMRPEDFQLRLRPTEDRLAKDIADAFSELNQDVLRSDDALRSDILNTAFGSFLSGAYIDDKELGQYLTPTEVVRFMICLALEDMCVSELEDLYDPAGTYGIVLDPSCGVGSFLTEFVNTVSTKISGRAGPQAGRRWAAHMVRHGIVGIDKSERMIRLALTNLAMYGAANATLHLANALSRTGPEAACLNELNGRVRLILSNPPFGAEFSGRDLDGYNFFRNGTNWNGAVNSEVLFMERYLEWLAPGGRLVVVVPDSILTNRGIFANLRRNLLPLIELRAVVSLPQVTFEAAGTTTKTSVLYLRKRHNAAPSRRRAFFAVCADVGFDVSTRGGHREKVSRRDGDLPRILRQYESGTSAPLESRWLEANALPDRWDAAFNVFAVDRVLSEARAGTAFTVATFADLVSERENPTRLGKQPFQYIEISDVRPDSMTAGSKFLPGHDAPSRARKVVRAGDILVSTVRPERRAIAVVGEHQDGAICTTGFAVLRPKGIHPLVLAALLRSDFVTSQLLRHNIGIAYPAIDEACILTVVLPSTAERLEQLEAVAAELWALERQVRLLRTAFSDGVAAVTATPTQS